MTNYEFINRIRSLYNIDHYKLPELSNEHWEQFRNDPPRYLAFKADRGQSDAILREVERRQEIKRINNEA